MGDGLASDPEADTSGIAVEEVCTETALRALAPDWSELLERTSNGILFLTPEWLLSWWHSFAQRADGPDAEPLVLALRRRGRLCGLAPLVIETERPGGLRIRVVRFLGHTLSDYLDFALAGDGRTLLRPLVSHLARCQRWDVIDLREFNGDSPILDSLLESLREQGLRVQTAADSTCWFAPIQESWDAFYRARFDREGRKDHRREWRLLENHGPVRAELRGSPALEDGWLEELAALERSHPEAAAGRSGNFNAEPMRSFLAEVLPRLDRRGWLLRATLHSRDELIAYYLGFRYGDACALYATAYRKSFRQSAAGKLLLIRTLEQLWQSGARGIDLLRGNTPLKRQWAPVARRNTRIMVVRARLGSQLRGWLCFAALPALAQRAPRLHHALHYAGRHGWGATALRGLRTLRGTDPAEHSRAA